MLSNSGCECCHLPYELGQLEYAHDTEHAEDFDDSDHPLTLCGVSFCIGRVLIAQL